MNVTISDAQFQQLLSAVRQPSFQQNPSTYIKDTDNTGMYVFDGKTETIFEYLDKWERLAASKFPDVTRRKEALLSRFTITDKDKLGDDVVAMNYNMLLIKMYEKLGASLTDTDFTLVKNMTQIEGEHFWTFSPV